MLSMLRPEIVELDYSLMGYTRPNLRLNQLGQSLDKSPRLGLGGTKDKASHDLASLVKYN